MQYSPVPPPLNKRSPPLHAFMLSRVARAGMGGRGGVLYYNIDVEVMGISMSVSERGGGEIMPPSPLPQYPKEGIFAVV